MATFTIGAPQPTGASREDIALVARAVDLPAPRVVCSDGRDQRSDRAGGETRRRRGRRRSSPAPARAVRELHLMKSPADPHTLVVRAVTPLPSKPFDQRAREAAVARSPDGRSTAPRGPPPSLAARWPRAQLARSQLTSASNFAPATHAQGAIRVPARVSLDQVRTRADIVELHQDSGHRISGDFSLVPAPGTETVGFMLAPQ